MRPRGVAGRWGISPATFEELHGTFMLKGRGTSPKRTEIPALACLGIFLARVQPIAAIPQFADHPRSLPLCSQVRITPSLARASLEWLEVGEVGFEDLFGNPPRCQTTRNRHRSPSEVEVEIAQGC